MTENLSTESNAILITGPTASGKSALAVALAERHGGVVINADSMQVYDTLHRLTARPDEADMRGIPHRLYGHVSAASLYSTGEWLREVGRLLPVLRQEGRMPIFVGGTGLYFKALTGGLSDMPPIPPELRARLRSQLAEEGPASLHARLTAGDPLAAAKLNLQDGQRILRALEVLEASGRSIRSFQAGGDKLVDPDRARKIVVLPERAVLRERIDRRFARMLGEGAVEEVRALLKLDLPPELPVMKAIGVPQIAALLRGEITLDEAIERGAAATRQYAKRQMTWFRNQMDESWQRLDPATGLP